MMLPAHSHHTGRCSYSSLEHGKAGFLCINVAHRTCMPATCLLCYVHSHHTGCCSTACWSAAKQRRLQQGWARQRPLAPQSECSIAELGIVRPLWRLQVKFSLQTPLVPSSECFTAAGQGEASGAIKLGRPQRAGAIEFSCYWRTIKLGCHRRTIKLDCPERLAPSNWVVIKALAPSS